VFRLEFLVESLNVIVKPEVRVFRPRGMYKGVVTTRAVYQCMAMTCVICQCITLSRVICLCVAMTRAIHQCVAASRVIVRDAVLLLMSANNY